MGPSLVTGFAPFPGPQQWVATPRLSSVYQWGVAITKPLFLSFFFLALHLPTVVAYLSCLQCNLCSLTSHPLAVPRARFMLPLVTCTPCTNLRLAMFRPTPHTNSKCSPTQLQLINSSLAVNQVFKHLYLACSLQEVTGILRKSNVEKSQIPFWIENEVSHCLMSLYLLLNCGLLMHLQCTRAHTHAHMQPPPEFPPKLLVRWTQVLYIHN